MTSKTGAIDGGGGVVCQRSSACEASTNLVSASGMGTPASIDTCENLIQMLLRRRQSSLSDRAGNYRKLLLELGHPVTLRDAKAYPEAISGIMWEASWRGMSTALQVASPPLHVQTLTLKWWTSTPASLRFGPSEYLLRALNECATNLDRFWQSIVGRMKPYGFYFLDPRLVSFEFRAGDKRVHRNCRRVTSLLSSNTGNQRVMRGRKL